MNLHDYIITQYLTRLDKGVVLKNYGRSRKTKRSNTRAHLENKGARTRRTKLRKH